MMQMTKMTQMTQMTQMAQMTQMPTELINLVYEFVPYEYKYLMIGSSKRIVLSITDVDPPLFIKMYETKQYGVTDFWTLHYKKYMKNFTANRGLSIKVDTIDGRLIRYYNMFMAHNFKISLYNLDPVTIEDSGLRLFDNINATIDLSSMTFRDTEIIKIFQYCPVFVKNITEESFISHCKDYQRVINYIKDANKLFMPTMIYVNDDLEYYKKYILANFKTNINQVLICDSLNIAEFMFGERGGLWFNLVDINVSHKMFKLILQYGVKIEALSNVNEELILLALEYHELNLVSMMLEVLVRREEYLLPIKYQQFISTNTQFNKINYTLLMQIFHDNRGIIDQFRRFILKVTTVDNVIDSMTDKKMIREIIDLFND